MPHGDVVRQRDGARGAERRVHERAEVRGADPRETLGLPFTVISGYLG